MMDKQAWTLKTLKIYVGFRDRVYSGEKFERTGPLGVFRENGYEIGNIVETVFVPGMIPGPIVKILDMYKSDDSLWGGVMICQLAPGQVIQKYEREAGLWTTIALLVYGSDYSHKRPGELGLRSIDVAREMDCQESMVREEFIRNGWQFENGIYWVSDDIELELVLMEE